MRENDWTSRDPGALSKLGQAANNVLSRKDKEKPAVYRTGHIFLGVSCKFVLSGNKFKESGW